MYLANSPYPAHRPGLEAFAAGDFVSLAHRFKQMGYEVALPARGVMRVAAASQPASRVLLSVGIHGDETAPIELVEDILQRLSAAPRLLASDLLVVLGNPDAVAAGKRFIDTDMNRLFREQAQQDAVVAEAGRAAEIMQITRAFFDAEAKRCDPRRCDPRRWHLDLHTTIRPSRHERFAILPVTNRSAEADLLAWLGGAGIEAGICSARSSQPAPTFSSFTARHCHAISATLELGQVAKLGSNQLSHLTRVRDALLRLLSGEEGEPSEPSDQSHPPVLYDVTCEIIRHSEAFAFALTDDELHTFCPLPPYTLVARDGDQLWRTGPEPEYLVFPNPAVELGLRAGILVRRRHALRLDLRLR